MSDLVYRISTSKEWMELQSNGSTFGGELDKNTGFIHLSKLDQVNLILLEYLDFSSVRFIVNSKSSSFIEILNFEFIQ
jgi:uncharacterized protein (DUF952 family)